MAATSKRAKAIRAKVDSRKLYPVADAVALVKECAVAKFDESIDVAVQLGVDAKKSDQVVRGSVVLPSGTGKSVRVAVFTQGAKADEARAAGADIVGMEDLAEKVKAGQLDFDIVIASPDAMRVVGALGQILGPRGLMPNPKAVTVTTSVASTVKDFKGGKVEYRLDKTGNLHVLFGKVTFKEDQLLANLKAIQESVDANKPPGAKGVYWKKLFVCTTMGPSVRVSVSALQNSKASDAQ